MELLSLPNELLETIASYTLPEGFKGLSLSCKALHTVCQSHLTRFNKLSRNFTTFIYRKNKPGETISHPTDPTNLLEWVADDRAAGAFIREADLTQDWVEKCYYYSHIDFESPLARLCEKSFYLQAAGLDPKEYFEALWKEGVMDGWPYQYTSVFILTLLPNIEELTLQKRWNPNRDVTIKLLNNIVSNARSPGARLMNRPSLGQLSSLCVDAMPRRVALDRIAPFLALPKLRSLKCSGLQPMEDSFKSITSECNYGYLGQTLERLELSQWALHPNNLKELLDHTPRLKSLSLFPVRTSINLGELVEVAAGAVGMHLEVLEIDLPERAINTQRHISLRGFTRLHTLAMHPNFMLAILASHASTRAGFPAETSPRNSGSAPSSTRESWICDLLPSTVEVLKDSLSDDDYDTEYWPLYGADWREVKVMFHHIVADKASKLSNITYVKLKIFKHNDDGEFVDWSTQLIESARAVGVTIDLIEFDRAHLARHSISQAA